MQYKTHTELQGSPEWKAGRSGRHNASELALAMGFTMNGKTRAGLIRRLATGVEDEISPKLQEIFDDGHRYEARARLLAEEIISGVLFQITASIDAGLAKRIGASFDGLTDDDEVMFEHKTLNADLATALDQGVIPDEYHPQMEQGLLVSGATRCLFMASKWDENNNLIEEKHCWYESQPALRAKILPTWRQFEEDVANYQHVEVIPAVVANPIRDFPAVRYEVVGMSLTSNVVSEVKPYVLAEVVKYEKKPVTDQEFADLDAFTKKARAAVKKSVLLRETVMAGLLDFDQFFRDMQDVESVLTKAAISGENRFKAEKANRKQVLVTKARDEFGEHLSALWSRVGGRWIPEMDVSYWSEAIKGLSSMTSIEGALDAALANAKIDACQATERIEINQRTLREMAADYPMLLKHEAQLVLKAPDDMIAQIKSWIADHKEAEQKRIEAEREKIRAEEEARAEARAKAEKNAAQQAEQSVQAPTGGQPQEPAVAAPVAEIKPSQQPVADDGERLKLGEINAHLYPLSLTADALKALGFDPVGTQGAAKLYRATDFRAICVAIVRHVDSITPTKRS